MPDKYALPELVRPIPKQYATIGSPFRLDARDYIQHPQGADAPLIFTACGEDNFPLPKGLECTKDGVLQGAPAKGSFRPQGYVLTIEVETEVGRVLLVDVELMIARSIRLDNIEAAQDQGQDSGDANDFDEAIDVDQKELAKLAERIEEEILNEAEMDRDKKKVWQAIFDEKSVPDIQSIFDRDITYDEIYHLMGRFAYFVIWNADNPNGAGDMQRLLLEGASEHFNVYDRGACISAAPKQLFDHARTLHHAINTAKAMAREVLNRGWRVEFGGFDKMVRSAWVEMEAVAEKQNKETAYAHYFPSDQDYELLDEARLKLQ